jgi:predicted protein tyrosine phosphatase
MLRLKVERKMTTKTEEIFKLSAPYANPYQGSDRRILFVCSAGLLRSATAANLFAKRGFNTRSAGSASYALIPLSANLIAWADRVFFVKKENYEQALQTFAGTEFEEIIKNKGTVLSIQDIYSYNEPELIKLLEEQVDL